MPAKNDRLTKEERLAKAKEAADEAERIRLEQEKGQHASPSPTPPPPSPSPSPSPASVSPSPTPPPPSPSPSPDPYQVKAREQGRENIVLNAKAKKRNEAIDNASKVIDPTDDEMKAIYPEWEDMTELEKKLAVKTEKSDRRFNIIHASREEEKNIEDWSAKVDTFTGDPKTLVTYPELEGKLDDFILFASRPTRVAVPFDILVSAFLHDETKHMKSKKKEMFPSGEHRGEPIKKKSDKIGLEEARKIRETDYPRYIRLTKEHKIDTSIA